MLWPDYSKKTGQDQYTEADKLHIQDSINKTTQEEDISKDEKHTPPPAPQKKTL